MKICMNRSRSSGVLDIASCDLVLTVAVVSPLDSVAKQSV